MTNLLELAAKVEAAEGPTFELMCDAFDLCFPKPQTLWNDLGNWSDEYTQWQARASAFCAFLEVGAWENAAMMLVPEGWRLAALCQRSPWFVRLETDDFDSITWGSGEDWTTDVVMIGKEVMASAATPALALTAAAIRARSEVA